MRSKPKFVAILAVLCWVLSTQALTAAPIVIDDFNAPPSVFSGVIINPGSYSNTDAGLPVANTIGGVREVSASFNSAVGGSGDALFLAYGSASIITPGAFSFASFGDDPTTVTLTYDGVAGAGLGLNANLAGEDGIVFDFTILDAATIGSTLTVALTDGDGDIFTSVQAVLGSGDKVFLFSSFLDSNGAGNGALNLSDIDRIQLTIVGLASSDYEINAISTTDKIPEPSSLVIAGVFVGLLGGGFLLRRRWSRDPIAIAA